MITRVFLIITFSFCHFYSTSQNLTDQTLSNISVPEFVYGEAELDSFIQDNLCNPFDLREMGITCEINVAVSVDTLGMISKITILQTDLNGVSRNKNPLLDMKDGTKLMLETEAKRVINLSSGLWIINPEDYKKELRKTMLIKFDPDQFSKNGISSHKIRLPEDASRYYNNGVKKLQEKKPILAIRYLERSLQLKKDVDTYYNLGITFFKIHALEKACENWNLAQKLGDPEVSNLINKYCGK